MAAPKRYTDNAQQQVSPYLSVLLGAKDKKQQAVVAQGNTNWQQLACTFTPTTGYGQIEMKITGATDATGVNRYFYVDDMNIAYPAGVAINLGDLDLWANGLPVTPAIATVPSLGGVWDEPLSVHQIAGSAGKILSDGSDNAELAAIK